MSGDRAFEHPDMLKVADRGAGCRNTSQGALLIAEDDGRFQYVTLLVALDFRYLEQVPFRCAIRLLSVRWKGGKHCRE